MTAGTRRTVCVFLVRRNHYVSTISLAVMYQSTYLPQKEVIERWKEAGNEVSSVEYSIWDGIFQTALWSHAYQHESDLRVFTDVI